MYRVIILPYFRRQLKRYVKKYRDIKGSVIDSLKDFRKSKFTRIGGSVYKIRLKVKGLPRGKNKSFRLVVLVIEIEKFVVPVAIYFKGDKETLTKKEINQALEEVFFELKAQKLLE